MSRLRSTLRRMFPPAALLVDSLRRTRRQVRAWRLARRERAEIFTEYFRTNQWADAESRSGQGSNLNETRIVREALPELIAELGINSLVDLPCGDFFWMQHVDLGGVHYTGGDIVAPMIESNRRKFGSDCRVFRVIDLCREAPPKADILLCRDALVHLSNADALAAIENIVASDTTWLLTTTFPGVSGNRDIATGMWRPLNLEQPPFDFPAPLRLFNEEYEGQHGRYRDKSIALWRVADIARRGAPKGETALSSG